MTKIEPVINPETGAAVYPHFDADGETITPERIAEAEAERQREGHRYGAEDVAESLRDHLAQLIGDGTGYLAICEAGEPEAYTGADIAEVSDALDSTGPLHDFTLTAHDGRTFRVRISETLS